MAGRGLGPSLSRAAEDEKCVPKFRTKVLDSVTLEGYLLDTLPKAGEEGRAETRPFVLDCLGSASFSMFEHPVLNTIVREGFVALGWFAPGPSDDVPALSDGSAARFVILIGNAGPAMFQRFAQQRREGDNPLDQWCGEIIGSLADALGAKAVFPSDRPALPFLTWARASGVSHRSPLGLNIHADYGLWHAYRAALLFPIAFDFPRSSSRHPCESCAEKPCLTACPVHAFDGR